MLLASPDGIVSGHLFSSGPVELRSGEVRDGIFSTTRESSGARVAPTFKWAQECGTTLSLVFRAVIATDGESPMEVAV